MTLTKYTVATPPANFAHNDGKINSKNHVDWDPVSGRLWRLVHEQPSAGGNGYPRLFYSNDNGATWTNSGVTFPGSSYNIVESVMQWDQDGNALYIMVMTVGGAYAYLYRLAPDSTRVNFTMTYASGNSILGTVLQYETMDMVIVKAPAGSAYPYYAWLAGGYYTGTSGSYTGYVSIDRIGLASNGQFSRVASSVYTGPASSGPVYTRPRLAFAHTGDGKTCDPTTADVFLGYTYKYPPGSSSADGYYVRRYSYNTTVTNDYSSVSTGSFVNSTFVAGGNTYQSAHDGVMVYDAQGRLMVIAGYNPMGGTASPTAVMVVEMNHPAGTNTVSIKSQTVLSGVIAAGDWYNNSNVPPAGAFDNQGNLYAFHGSNTVAAWVHKWERATGLITQMYDTWGVRPLTVTHTPHNDLLLMGDSSPATYIPATLNVPPLASTNTAPADNTVLNRAVANTFSWTFADNNPADTQSAFDLRYRKVGDTTWTTVSQTTANSYWTAPSGTFTGTGKIDYEWQVRTYDPTGAAGAWTASHYFSASDKPASPTIVTPTNGGTVSISQVLQWSDPNQDSYEVVRVKDGGSIPDTTTVYYDSNEVVNSSTRSVTLNFPVNNRWEWAGVRVKYLGLWSDYTYSRVNVSYDTPAAPTISATADDPGGRVLLAVLSHDNLLSTVNSTFESGVGNWISDTGAPTVTTDSAHHLYGSNSLKVTATGTSAGINLPGASGFNVTAGVAYTISAWVYSTQALSLKISTGSNGGAGPYTESPNFNLQANAWTRLTLTWTPSSTGKGSISLVTYGITAGQSIYVDGAKAEAGTAVTDWSAGGISTTSMDLYRSVDDGGYERIAAGLLGGGDSLYDYTAPSGKSLSYYATANGSNATTKNGGSVATQQTLAGIWLHDPEDPAASIHRFPWDAGRSISESNDVQFTHFAGRALPVAEFGEYEERGISLTMPLEADNGDVDAMHALIDRKTVLCYRDGRGRKEFVILSGGSFDDVRWGEAMSFAATAVDYSEAV